MRWQRCTCNFCENVISKTLLLQIAAKIYQTWELFSQCCLWDYWNINKRPRGLDALLGHFLVKRIPVTYQLSSTNIPKYLHKYTRSSLMHQSNKTLVTRIDVVLWKHIIIHLCSVRPQTVSSVFITVQVILGSCVALAIFAKMSFQKHYFYKLQPKFIKLESYFLNDPNAAFGIIEILTRGPGTLTLCLVTC